MRRCGFARPGPNSAIHTNQLPQTIAQRVCHDNKCGLRSRSYFSQCLNITLRLANNFLVGIELGLHVQAQGPGHRSASRFYPGT
ncbi:hypothetical protein AB1N83_004534 [Pleurotus pulmonarius]